MLLKCGTWCLTQRRSNYYNWAKLDLCSLLIPFVFCRNHVLFLEQLRSAVIFGTKQNCEVVRGSSLSFCVPQGQPILWASRSVLSCRAQWRIGWVFITGHSENQFRRKTNALCQSIWLEFQRLGPHTERLCWLRPGTSQSTPAVTAGPPRNQPPHN